MRNVLSRTSLTMVVAIVMLSGCVRQAAPGLRVKGYPADLVFGVQPIAVPVPANVIGPTQPSQSASDLLPPQEFASVPPLGLPNLTALPPPVPCPAAAENAFASAPAGTTVPPKERPQVGSYRWKTAGTESSPATAGVKIPLGGFEQRLIRRIDELGPSTNTSSLAVAGSSPPGEVFTFQTVQPALNGDQVVTTWKVDSEPATVTTHAPAVAIPNQRVGGPERGISIAAIDRYSSSGALTSSFRPPSGEGLLVLPLEVRQGEQFQAVSVDPASQVTYNFTATVARELDVDACGSIVASWLVSGHMTIAGGQSASYDYDVGFATQFGGYPVYERVHQDDANGKVDVVDTIGQLTPGPVPAGKG